MSYNWLTMFFRPSLMITMEWNQIPFFLCGGKIPNGTTLLLLTKRSRWYLYWKDGKILRPWKRNSGQSRLTNMMILGGGDQNYPRSVFFSWSNVCGTGFRNVEMAQHIDWNSLLWRNHFLVYDKSSNEHGDCSIELYQVMASNVLHPDALAGLLIIDVLWLLSFYHSFFLCICLKALCLIYRDWKHKAFPTVRATKPFQQTCTFSQTVYLSRCCFVYLIVSCLDPAFFFVFVPRTPMAGCIYIYACISQLAFLVGYQEALFLQHMWGESLTSPAFDLSSPPLIQHKFLLHAQNSTLSAYRCVERIFSKVVSCRFLLRKMSELEAR